MSTYIKISFNLKEQVEVKKEEIKELESKIDNLEKVNGNLETIKQEYLDIIDKKNKRIWLLLGTNALMLAILIFK